MSLTWSTAIAETQRYSPEDLYDFETIVLDNGFTALLNDRGESPGVAVRLVVGTGTNDYSCELRELPHVVEHLMFSGYEGLTESDLDATIAAWGGAWNAYTYSRRTTYDVRVHSSYLKSFTVLLTMMFEETEVTSAELELARRIVNTEAGGVAGPIRQWLFRHGITEGGAERAYRQFVPASSEWCEGLISADEITLEHVQNYIQDEHRADNMTLIVVGQFDVAAYKEVLDFTFGALESETTHERSASMPDIRFEGTEYVTRSQVLLGQEAYVCFGFGVPDRTDQQRAAANIIATYLQSQIFDELRVQRGLAYDPDAELLDFDDFSTLMLDATVAINDVEETIAVMEVLIQDLLENGVPESSIDHIRESQLLRRASAFETNGSFASFYEINLPVWRETGRFPDLDTYYSEVTTAETVRVANRYFELDSALRYRSQPMLSYGSAASLAAFPLIGIVFLRFSRRRRAAGQFERDGAI